MTLRIRSVAFNFGPDSDALKLRTNGAQPLLMPEWLAGPAGPQTAPAAYAIADVAHRSIRIAADFERSASTPAVVEVRALGLTVGGMGPVLGDAWSRPVYFGAGPVSEPQLFELPAHLLAASGVGAQRVRWRWQCRTWLSDWQDFAQTEHRVYVTLRRPTLPWSQGPGTPMNTQLPWVEVLDHACRWAQGAVTVEEAAHRITQAVYALGMELIQYDCPGFGATHYTRYTPTVVFECTEFLERLAGGFGNGNWVNCVDCAAITATFANILGCDLWQSGMYSPSGHVFDLNPVLAIGSTTWGTACGWPGFGYHEVAWANDCTAEDDVYDACLMVDGGLDPGHAPLTALLPAPMRFGRNGDGGYRDHLCAPAGRANCEPQPATTRRRRPVI